MKGDNPVVEYLGYCTKVASQKAKEDFEHWARWKEAPNELQRKQLLQESVNRFNPLVQHLTSMWGSAPQVNKPALQLAVKDAVVKAHETWQPGKSSLNTWVNWHTRKALRHVAKHSDLAYTSEARSGLMGPYQRALDTLREELGRDPTDGEIAEQMRQPEKTVRRVRMDLSRADVSSSSFAEDPVSLFAQKQSPIAMDVISLMDKQPDSPDKDVFENQRDRMVYNYMRGVGGVPQLTAKGDIAKRIGVSPATVTRSVKAIEQIIRKHV